MTALTDKLRTRLDDLIQGVNSLEIDSVQLDALAFEIPHTIHVLPTPWDELSEGINCVAYALGLIGRFEDFRDKSCNRFYADTRFLSSLIEGGVLRPCAEREGALAVWSSAGVVLHVGLVSAPGRATSKWGAGGLYEHGLFEVPKCFGEDVAFYDPVDPEVVLAYLDRFHGFE